ncbi:MAG: hypothetical protein HWE10_09030 [Gammaproteobacteria bacterium]|nr:hypothetical protein [Gammaproteobacteria bacterium]
MIRLFLSLYLAICLGLVVINLTSNVLFQHLQRDIKSNNQLAIEQIVQIAQLVRFMDKQQLEQAQANFPYQIQILTSQQVQLLPEQQRLLDEGKVLTVYEMGDRMSIFVQRSEQQVLHIAGIPLGAVSDRRSTLEQTIIILSYLSLAIFVLAWSRPLWRDLYALKQASEQIQLGNFELTPQVKKRSVIYPVVASFNVMANKIAELINHQKQMTHAVSHDIRTPLARIKFSLAILQQEPEKLEQTSKDMLDDVAEIDHLTSELLTFAKLDTEHSLRIENVNLKQLLENLAEKLRRNSSIQLKTECIDECWFHCDGHLIERCLQNLITNGFKYASSQVVVRIGKKTTATAQQVVIEVHDDGPGIPVHQRVSVLEAFTTADDSRNKKSGGFGLGLAIVNKIVRAHKGQIEILDSELGGVLVKVCLR